MPDGAFALSPDGVVLEQLPECTFAEDKANKEPGSMKSRGTGWHNSPEHHVLYRWSQEACAVGE
jgi:hypothetical protein